MNKNELKKILDEEVEKYSMKSFEELSEYKNPATYEYDLGYYVQVELLEKNNDYVHVVVMIDDGSLFRAMAPLTRSFIVYRDGRKDV